MNIGKMLTENTKHLLWKRVFRYAVMIIQPCLCSPTNIQGTCYMSVSPVKYLLNLVPIANFFKLQILHRRTCNNHSVKVFIGHLLKIAIKHHHVLHRSVLRRMAFQLHEVYLQLQRCIWKQPYEVGFRCNLQRHEIKNRYFKRTYILSGGTRIVHDEDVFFLQYVYRRQPVW